jgi:hypothetical protein
MDIHCGFEQLVHDETFVDILQNGTSPDHIMQVSICKHTQQSTTIMSISSEVLPKSSASFIYFWVAYHSNEFLSFNIATSFDKL